MSGPHQVTKLPEVATHGVEDPQQDVDEGGVQLRRVGGVDVLGQDLLEVTWKHTHRHTIYIKHFGIKWRSINGQLQIFIRRLHSEES